MRIIHLSCITPPEVGGIGKVAAIEVAELRKRDLEADVISLTTHHGFRVGNAGSISALNVLLRDADIVHLHYPFFGTAECLPALKKKDVFKKLVVTLHMDATAGGIKGFIFNLYRSLFQDRVLKAADVLLAGSRDYIANSSFAAYADNVIELPFGVDEALFAPGEVDRKRFNIPEGVPLVLFIGGMDRAHHFKGVPQLLEAMAGIPDAHLLLVGEGALRAGYEAHAKKLGIDSRCHFAGRLESEDLAIASRSADVLAFPSISAAEAFGLVAIEAQASGIPVVASNLPGVRTVIEDGVTGLLVPPGDVLALQKALSELLADPVRRARMGAAARERVLKMYTWSAHADKLVEIYRKLV